MRLSRLIYECVKASTALHEVSFSFDEFMACLKEDGDRHTTLWSSQEYSRSFDRSFRDINAFFLRLMELDDILPDFTVDVSENIVLGEDKEYHLDLSSYPINNIRTLFQYGYRHSKQYVLFDDFGEELILHGYDESRPVYLTYSVAIPRFSRADLNPYTLTDDEEEVDENIDLTEQYHIPEKVFALCIDFVQAKQKDDYEPAVASAMMIEVESKLQGLRKENTGPFDDHIEVTFKI